MTQRWMSSALFSASRLGFKVLLHALFSRDHVVETYPRTRKRGRPRRPKMVACPALRYGQVVKERNERRQVVGVFRKAVFGDAPLHYIHTVYIEKTH
jgi:hypothetical protein